MGLVGPSWDLWDHTTFEGKWDRTVFFLLNCIKMLQSPDPADVPESSTWVSRSARSPFFAEVLNLFRQKFYQKYHPSEKPNTWKP